MKHDRECRGNGLALPCVHLHDVPLVHQKAGQDLLVCNLKYKFAFPVMDTEGLIEARRQVDLRTVFTLASLVHIQNRADQRLFPGFQSLAD